MTFSILDLFSPAGKRSSDPQKILLKGPFLRGEFFLEEFGVKAANASLRLCHRPQSKTVEKSLSASESLSCFISSC